MTERRDMLKMMLAAGAAGVAGCSKVNTPEQKRAPAAQPAVAGQPTPPGALDITFKGMALFVLPKDTSVRRAEVALVRVGHAVHHGTLRIPRVAVLHGSDAVPVAANESSVFYRLEGQAVSIIPRDNADPTTWPADPPADNLRIGRAEVNPYVEGCGSGTTASINWLIDIEKDLVPNAMLAANWRTSPALFGRIILSHGVLEEGLPTVLPDYRYTVVRPNEQPRTRLALDFVRYRLTAPFVEVRMNDTRCIIDTSRREKSMSEGPVDAGLDHVPGEWMNADGPLEDYLALYDLLDPATVPKGGTRTMPSGRTSCAIGGPATGGCGCCPVPKIYQ
jgi:hypothetical protein